MENILYLELTTGRVVIEMRPDLAPLHVARIKELVRQGFYDGVVFHRVIEGFMAQTGDPTGTGMGGSGQKLKAEFSNEPHVRGTVSMARAQDPNSADSQFFIVYDDARYLDNNYTVWGKVVEGMEYIADLKKGDPSRNGQVENPDKIVTLRVAADVEKKKAAKATPAKKNDAPKVVPQVNAPKVVEPTPAPVAEDVEVPSTTESPKVDGEVPPVKTVPEASEEVIEEAPKKAAAGGSQ